MSVSSYHTIQSPAEGVYKEKGSKFVAFAYPVESEAEVRSKLEALRKKYYDARHHCFAYVMGTEKQKFRSFDDGEPNHSAGDPILGQIRSKAVTNVLIVVVRYFGGIKLGVGGLISAYKAAAEAALNNAVVIEKEILKSLSITYEYSSTSEVMRLIREFDLVINERHFESYCSIKAGYKVKVEEKLLEKINLLKATGHSLEFTMD